MSGLRRGLLPALAGLLAWTCPALAAPSAFPAGTAVSTDAAGNLYAAVPATVNGSLVVQTSKYGPLDTRPLWTQTFSIAGLTTPAGIALDGAGGVYVAVNDFSVSAAALVKYDAGGVFASSQTAPYPGASFAPLIGSVVVDPATAAVYAAETFVDPNRHGLTSVLVQAYDYGLAPLATQVVAEDPGIIDESAGLSLDAAGDVSAGVTQNPDTPSPSYFLVEFSPRLGRVLSRVSTGPLDPIALMNCELSGDGQSGPVGSTLPQPLTIKLTSRGGPVSMPVTFVLGSFPRGAKGQSLSVTSTQTDANGTASTTLTLGDSTGTYRVGVGRVACFPLPGHAPSFTETATGGMTLAALSPLSQNATVTKKLTAPLKVSVTAGGKPSTGTNVRWDFISLPSGTTGQDLLEVKGFPSTVVASRDVPTDANGESDVQVQLGNMTGDYLVAAQVTGATPSRVTFSLHGQLFFQVALSTYSIFPVTGPFPLGGYVSDLNKTTMTVTAYGAGGLTDTVTGYPLVLVSTYVVFSGGHDHEDGHRPIGVFELGSGLSPVPHGVSGQTDSQGMLTAVYRSSWTGGYEVLAASSAFDGNVSSTQPVTVQVPGLVLLPDSDLYVKIGGKCEHHGPSDNPKVPSRCHTPDHNHWASTMVAAGLPLVAADYAALPEVVSKGLPPIRVNDASLPFGGLLDVKGNWRPDHQAHREGKSVDIRTNPFNSDGVPLGFMKTLEEFAQIRIHPGCTVDVHSPGKLNQHFHLECSKPPRKRK